MAKPPLAEIRWRPGKSLQSGNDPGFEPATTIEDGMRIERAVAWRPNGKHRTGPAAWRKV